MPIEEILSRLTVLVVAAHPDDETIGAGGLLGRLRNPYVLHVTDGSPTLGCVAVDKATMVKILQWLDPGRDPVIRIGLVAQQA